MLTTKITLPEFNKDPARWVENKPLNKDLVKKFVGVLEQHKFWDLPSNNPREGADGSQWIIEGVRNGRHHVVDRWSPPSDDPIHILGLAFAVNLAELKRLPREIN